MTLQALLVMSLVMLSAVYVFRGSLMSFFGGGCASGCGGCKSGCPARKLQAVEARLDRTRHQR